MMGSWWEGTHISDGVTRTNARERTSSYVWNGTGLGWHHSSVQLPCEISNVFLNAACSALGTFSLRTDTLANQMIVRVLPPAPPSVHFVEQNVDTHPVGDLPGIR